MNERISIGEFLAQNVEFEFHVPEYVESKRVIARVQERFGAFRDTFWRAGAEEQPWQARRNQIAEAAREVPAYQGIDWSRAEYWREIRLVDKNELRAQSGEYRHPSFAVDQLWTRDTSGTSGPPMPIWYAPEFSFEFHLFTEAKVAWIADALTPEMLDRPILSVALVDKKSLNNRVWTSPDASRGLTVRQLYDERCPGAAEALFRLLDRHRPAMLGLKPNILASIVRGAGERKRAAADYLDLVISGGAPLDEELRRAAEERLGAPVYNAYGLTEIGVVASECRRQDGLHIYENDVIAEILAEDGTLRRTGSGELVVSSVANAAMPLLRYRTGDFVELTRDTCGCGRAGQRIRSISGRVVLNFTLSDGSEFAPTNFNELFNRFPVRELQITQTDLRRVEAKIEPLRSSPEGPLGSAEETALLDAVRRYMELQLRSLVEVRVSATTFSAGDKLQRYRSMAPRGHGRRSQTGPEAGRARAD
jgi:phenylacetate-coenzyme A ligase PaaK-like adenylate-forming protein